MNDSISLSSERTDELLSALARTHCRNVIQYFRQHSTEVVTTEDLARFICEQAQGDEDETNVEIRLHHATLPRLADAGVLDYDARSTTARYEGHPTLEGWLDQIVEREEALNAIA